ncbi:hypothetical protein LEP1GSC103_0101 [Leptospira borgpetersenii serovar Javanica str. UI 09931]|uniref:Uncharacterized protein n=1 Tax=Leptospira borgpetersenii serovar Javanica str. UI 09931 TaxID=1049767 RepID=A0AAV3JF11_LEPBO|nr:hypothetical protein C4Q31_04295 [Leptospira borgpetersenii serovar Ceylonica]EKQ92556.1 hypothetical protein LEP1GSC101_2499 [Leptospira borgpetersenii str. UI 09149]EMN57119.1 hypothetical protein LEP1GSC090_4048 [Leptospira borgpetersenii serovar Javanica str. MK146]EPG58636.1 hypothetical protein LEP1GSC103_0101 [Leptospira borgpetersenii serovar Javanica str. UI 09931]
MVALAIFLSFKIIVASYISKVLRRLKLYFVFGSGLADFKITRIRENKCESDYYAAIHRAL